VILRIDKSDRMIDVGGVIDAIAAVLPDDAIAFENEGTDP
jgi:hypothetical protein